MIRIDKTTFRSVQLHRNNAIYSFLLKICDLIRDLQLPCLNTNGTAKFQNILENEKAMELIFQNFVFNFYRQEQTKYSVNAEIIKWDLAEEGENISLLPQMHTDMVLRSRDETLVIDTKYSEDILNKPWHGHAKFRSVHLYQICSYLKNLEKNGHPDDEAMGILLYPQNDKKIDTYYKILGHNVRFVTLDLSVPWKNIESQLKSIIGFTPEENILAS